MATVHTKDELNDAMNRGDSTIEIEGDLAKHVIKIKATGGVAWAIAIGAIAIAVIAAVAAIPSGGTSTAGLPIATGAAAAFIGVETTGTAIAIAIAAGGVGVLTRLRSNYKIVEKSDSRVVLMKA